jgi:hypothetical protein
MPGLADDEASKQRSPLSSLGSRIPLGRVGALEEIAETVLYIVSD